MKCPTCGFENRPDARFCKQCGQPMQAQDVSQAPSTPSSVICPACGASAKLGARFCPRCGKPLPGMSAPATPPPAPAPPQPAIPSMPPTTPPSTTPPPPTGAAPAYAEFPTPPPPATPPASRRQLPRWFPWVAGVVAFLCIAAVVVAGVWVGPELLGATAPTAATPIPATPPTVAAPTEMPTAAPSPTEAPATETPAVAPPAETLTVAPPAETPTAKVPPTPTFDAQITISVIPETVRVGELLTLVATVNNVGEATLANLHYQLVGDFRSYFELVDGIGEIRHAGDFPPGATDQVSFVLRATQEGTAALQVYVLADVTSTSSKANLLSEVHTVSITSQ